MGSNSELDASVPVPIPSTGITGTQLRRPQTIRSPPDMSPHCNTFSHRSWRCFLGCFLRAFLVFCLWHSDILIHSEYIPPHSQSLQGLGPLRREQVATYRVTISATKRSRHLCEWKAARFHKIPIFPAMSQMESWNCWVLTRRSVTSQNFPWQVLQVLQVLHLHVTSPFWNSRSACDTWKHKHMTAYGISHNWHHLKVSPSWTPSILPRSQTAIWPACPVPEFAVHSTHFQVTGSGLHMWPYIYHLLLSDTIPLHPPIARREKQMQPASQRWVRNVWFMGHALPSSLPASLAQ